jgi:hypothetical protein
MNVSRKLLLIVLVILNFKTIIVKLCYNVNGHNEFTFITSKIIQSVWFQITNSMQIFKEIANNSYKQ